MTAAGRALALARRNVDVYSRYRLLLVSGAVEPVLYLLGIGLGVGSLVDGVRTAGGDVVGYAQFVGPALMAAAMMNSSLIDTVSVFYHYRYQRLYDAVLNTPLSGREVMAGEALWSMARATLYAAAFLAILAVAGLVPSWWGLLALPAAVLVAWAFAGVGLAIVTFLRRSEDTEVLQVVVLPLFVLSATFFPETTYPERSRWLLELSPLYHGVDLVRSLCLGDVGRPLDLVVHATVLVVVGAAGVAIAGRRIEETLKP